MLYLTWQNKSTLMMLLFLTTMLKAFSPLNKAPVKDTHAICNHTKQWRLKISTRKTVALCVWPVLFQQKIISIFFHIIKKFREKHSIWSQTWIIPQLKLYSQFLTLKSWNKKQADEYCSFLFSLCHKFFRWNSNFVCFYNQSNLAQRLS